MSEFQSLAHSRFDCKYHVVFVPKCRRKVLYGKIREFLIPIFKELAFQKGCKIIKGNMVQDHVHMFIEIPQSILFPKLLGTSRAKALLPLRDNLVGVSGILMGSNFEPGATQYRQLALNWLRYMNTLKIKNG